MVAKDVILGIHTKKLHWKDGQLKHFGFFIILEKHHSFPILPSFVMHYFQVALYWNENENNNESSSRSRIQQQHHHHHR